MNELTFFKSTDFPLTILKAYIKIFICDGIDILVATLISPKVHFSLLDETGALPNITEGHAHPHMHKDAKAEPAPI